MNTTELIELIDELCALPKENEWVEFKTGNVTTNDKLGQYLSGLSNAACIANQSYAYLVFGINDDTHNVEGTNYRFKNRKEGNEELELWIRRFLSPSIKFDHFICDYNSNHIELFRIPAAIGEPTNFKNHPYIRFDSSLTDLKKYPHYLRAIYNSQTDWSAQIIEKATIDDLEPIAIKIAREKYKEKNTNATFYDDIDNWSNKIFLDKLKITISGKITNTAIILLGKPETAHFISPAVAQITWKLDTQEKAYEHFGMPLFTEVNMILSKIRNVKYKFFPDNQLVAAEVMKYDSEVILEALNNCIAHQDYSRHSRILLTEQINKLIFSSEGSFFEGTAEDYTAGEKTPKKYRNKWLAEAMVNLNMIDSLGYGIHKMYKSQRKRYFPLPDYTKSTRDNVVLEIYGHTIDENYSKLLIEKKDDLSLTEVILLDKVQKDLDINDDAAKLLKKKGLIEGRKPNYYISASIAELTGQKASYTKNKGLDKDVYKGFILQHIKNHGFATREEIDTLLLSNLPDYMTEKQRKKKIHNLLQEMSGVSIVNNGSRAKSKWVLLKI
ncbi:transcriptional regulator [Flavobacterium gawalongense]|uniref:RNA-binding domain-containing protein n=1 Tax=Flavobacterium gawalongense TaxID=2594432 RepID=UPI001183F230|nr:RNA-binding domain-containing protein [Flavobacterium gawalongense]TRX11703.1 transcriptional regulator [Flavobacterium gawalongense]TRX29495.1 transcriptional regulator [Flavobacterium gawalongense]